MKTTYKIQVVKYPVFNKNKEIESYEYGYKMYNTEMELTSQMYGFVSYEECLNNLKTVINYEN